MSKTYTKERVEKAIKSSVGIMSTIARKLGCEWHTAQVYVNRWACTRAAYANEQESILDVAESKAYTLINEGDAGMIKWFLSRKGKGRGYTERTEITGADGGAIIIQNTGNLNTDEL